MAGQYLKYNQYRGLFHVRCSKWVYREHQVVAVVLPTVSRDGHFPDLFRNLHFQKQLATFSHLENVCLRTNEKSMSPCSCPVHVLNKPFQVSKHSSTMVLADAAERAQICFIYFPKFAFIWLEFCFYVVFIFPHYYERVCAAWCFTHFSNPHTPQVVFARICMFPIDTMLTEFAILHILMHQSRFANCLAL